MDPLRQIKWPNIKTGVELKTNKNTQTNSASKLKSPGNKDNGPGWRTALKWQKWARKTPILGHHDISGCEAGSQLPSEGASGLDGGFAMSAS